MHFLDSNWDIPLLSCEYRYTCLMLFWLCDTTHFSLRNLIQLSTHFMTECLSETFWRRKSPKNLLKADVLFEVECFFSFVNFQWSRITEHTFDNGWQGEWGQSRGEGCFWKRHTTLWHNLWNMHDLAHWFVQSLNKHVQFTRSTLACVI